MCAVSMVSQHYQMHYPVPTTFPDWQWPHYQELMRKAKLYDEMMKQPDCQDDAKAAWAKELERVMKERYGLTPNDPSLAAPGASTSAQDK